MNHKILCLLTAFVTYSAGSAMACDEHQTETKQSESQSSASSNGGTELGNRINNTAKELAETVSNATQRAKKNLSSTDSGSRSAPKADQQEKPAASSR